MVAIVKKRQSRVQGLFIGIFFFNYIQNKPYPSSFQLKTIKFSEVIEVIEVINV